MSECLHPEVACLDCGERMTAMTRPLAAPALDALSQLWFAAEEAMPVGWWFELFREPHRAGDVNPHTGRVLGHFPGPYVAEATKVWDGETLVKFEGESPEAALRALIAHFAALARLSGAAPREWD